MGLFDRRRSGSRISVRVYQAAVPPAQAVTGLPPPGALPVMAAGLLDGAPPPRPPDPAVFGGWHPGPPQPRGQRNCGCGCAQAGDGPCWQCGQAAPR